METILLVDDDPLGVEFMRLFLESDGYSILCAYSFSEGCSVLEQNHPAVLISDVELTDGSGAVLAQRAKAIGGIKVIGITGHSRLYLKEAGHDPEAFDEILTKPLELDSLKQALLKCLS